MRMALKELRVVIEEFAFLAVGVGVVADEVYFFEMGIFETVVLLLGVETYGALYLLNNLSKV